MSPKFVIALFIGFVGVWLVLWDFIDYLTTGFNQGIWDGSIVQNGLPSIFVGFILLVIAGVFGYKLR